MLTISLQIKISQLERREHYFISECKYLNTSISTFQVLVSEVSKGGCLSYILQLLTAPSYRLMHSYAYGDQQLKVRVKYLCNFKIRENNRNIQKWQPLLPRTKKKIQIFNLFVIPISFIDACNGVEKAAINLYQFRESHFTAINKLSLSLGVWYI